MKVLIVDDHSLFRQGLEMLFLMKLDFDVALHAESKQQALSNIAKHDDIDLVLLDYKLDKDDGLSVMAAIKARRPTLAVVIISGESNHHLILRALGEGAAGFISKSMHPDMLVDTIKRILNGQIYVPELARSEENELVQAAAKQAEIKQISDVAEFARSVVRDKDLSRRISPTENSEVISAFNSLMDEFEREREQLKELAYVDELTGIANRRMYIKHAQKAFKLARTGAYNLALIYLDLDKFKPLNDTYGHESGDIALISTANRLQENIRELDLAARLGGDEFVVIAHAIDDIAALSDYLLRLHCVLTEEITLKNGESWIPEISIGATLTDGNEELEDALKRSDSAMYQAKQSTDKFIII